MDKEKLEKYILPLSSILLSLSITVGGAYYSGKLQAALMEERIATLQRDQARHEVERGKEIAKNTTRGDDHEQRIVRLEVSLDVMQATLLEIKSDVKTLLAKGVKD